MTRAVEKSYGIIPLRKENNEWQVLLIKHQAGHWAFPKGRSEEGENPQEAAKREFNEETGLEVVEILEQAPLHENYIFRRGDSIIYKLVDFYLATVSGKIQLQEKEIADFIWVSLEQAKETATFKEGKNLCSEIENRLKLPL